MCLLALLSGALGLQTVLVTFVDNLPVSVGNGSDASAPTPQIAPHAIPGVTLVSNIPALGIAIYRGTRPDQDSDELCDLIMTYRNVETCEPDSDTTIDQTALPNDPVYPAQTYLNTTGTVALWQQNVFGNRNVRIGVIDTGVDLQNADIIPSLWTNTAEKAGDVDNDGDGVPGDVHCASFLGGTASGNCEDGSGHGSWVAGAFHTLAKSPTRPFVRIRRLVHSFHVVVRPRSRVAFEPHDTPSGRIHFRQPASFQCFISCRVNAHGQVGVQADQTEHVHYTELVNITHLSLRAVDSAKCGVKNSGVLRCAFCAGAIAAAVNNGYAIAGGVQLATLLPCQYLDGSGNGVISDAIQCFGWLASKNVQVISCSWGTTSNSAALQQAVSKLSAAGVFISTSAGNNGISTDNSPQYPSAYSMTMSAVVSVAATDGSGGLWTRSNYGSGTVQLAAPGVSVVSLGLDNTTKTLSGTSMVRDSPSAFTGSRKLSLVGPEQLELLSVQVDHRCMQAFQHAKDQLHRAHIQSPRSFFKYPRGPHTIYRPAKCDRHAQAAPQVTAIAALLIGQFQAAGFDVSNTNGIGQAIKTALIAGATPLPASNGRTIGGGLVNGAAAYTALQRSDLYKQGPTRRPSNTTGTSSITTAVIYVLIGMVIATAVYTVVLVLVLRYRQRPPKPIDLTGINLRVAQMPSSC